MAGILLLCWSIAKASGLRGNAIGLLLLALRKIGERLLAIRRLTRPSAVTPIKIRTRTRVHGGSGSSQERKSIKRVTERMTKHGLEDSHVRVTDRVFSKGLSARNTRAPRA